MHFQRRREGFLCCLNPTLRCRLAVSLPPMGRPSHSNPINDSNSRGSRRPRPWSRLGGDPTYRRHTGRRKAWPGYGCPTAAGWPHTFCPGALPAIIVALSLSLSLAEYKGGGREMKKDESSTDSTSPSSASLCPLCSTFRKPGSAVAIFNLP